MKRYDDAKRGLQSTTIQRRKIEALKKFCLNVHIHKIINKSVFQLLQPPICTVMQHRVCINISALGRPNYNDQFICALKDQHHNNNDHSKWLFSFRLTCNNSGLSKQHSSLYKAILYIFHIYLRFVVIIFI